MQLFSYKPHSEVPTVTFRAVCAEAMLHHVLLCGAMFSSPNSAVLCGLCAMLCVAVLYRMSVGERNGE